MIRKLLRWTAIAASTYVVCLLCYAAYRNSVDLGPDDYAIYSACLREAFFNQNEGEPAIEPFELVVNADVGSRQFHTLNSPYPRWVARLLLLPLLQRPDPGPSQFMDWDLIAKQLGVRRLAPDLLELPMEYSLTSHHELRRLLDPGLGEAFDAKYPRNLGYVDLSRIGYSFDGNEAKLEFDHVCGLCGGGSTVVLRRQADGSWKIIEARTTWVS